MFLKMLKKSILFHFIVLIISFPIFSQVNTPYLKVTSPNGGERLEAKSTQIIMWQSSHISEIKIEYSVSRGMIGIQ